MRWTTLDITVLLRLCFLYFSSRPRQPLHSAPQVCQTKDTGFGKSSTLRAEYKWYSDGRTDRIRRMPPYNSLFGHLLVANDVMSKVPRNAQPQYLTGKVRRNYPEVGPVFYLDLWPCSLPVLVVASPSATYQLTQEHSQPKAAGLRSFMRPFTNNNYLVTMEGQSWKQWPSFFNASFSASHLVTLVPEILNNEASISCEILREHVRRKQTFCLEKVTVNLTMDTYGNMHC